MTYERHIKLTDTLCILDGLTGTGKTLMLHILNCNRNLQIGKFNYTLEHLLISDNNGSNSASIKMLVDTLNFNNKLGREVNLRRVDLSSIFKTKRRIEYLKRLLKKDESNLEKVECPLVITHQIARHNSKLFEIYGDKLTYILMMRHPLYLIDHWASYIDLHGKNARDMTLWYPYDNKYLPWFIDENIDLYVNGNKYEQSIIAISCLMKDCYKAISNNLVLDIPFEKFVLDPMKYLVIIKNKIGEFDNNILNKVLKREKVPRERVTKGIDLPIYRRYHSHFDSSLETEKEEYESKLMKYEQKIAFEYKKILDNLVMEYEKHYGKWF